MGVFYFNYIHYLRVLKYNLMSDSIWNDANDFLFNMKVGDKYKISTETYVECVKRTDKRIYLSNGNIVTIKTLNGYKYLTSRSIVTRNKSYDSVTQILRDIEGYFIYQTHQSKTLYY
jgi:hypothetical protein